MPKGEIIGDNRQALPFPMPLFYKLIPLIVALMFGVLLLWGELWLI